MSSKSKVAGGPVTQEIESRIKQTPEHLFEAFLEIREPNDNEGPEVLTKYPNNISDHIVKTATEFAYPCKIPSDEQGEHFTFVFLDQNGTLFRFGYCRRSNRDASCLCIISDYPWFEVFYTILNDLSQIISLKSSTDIEQFLSSLYNYKLMSNEDFYKNEGKEIIEINGLPKNYSYNRPDHRKLPSMLSNRNFAVMFSRLGSEVMLSLFSHLLFERRILFVSSKLFHLTACAYSCLHLIYPMHWQNIFIPILPSTVTWTTQCTAPYIIGIHSTLFSTLNLMELGDVVIVNIDERKIESPYDDLNLFPKYLHRGMKKGLQEASQLAGDHLARVFLRAMANSIGNYSNGFIIRNEKLDFDRDLYLEQYLGSQVYTFMSTIAHTQMFDQFSRYRTFVQLQRETDVDEFDIEVKRFQQLQQSKKFKTNKKISKFIEKYIKDGTIINISVNATKSKKRKSLIDTKDERNKAANPVFEQVQNKAEKFQTAINKAGQRVASEASIVRNNLTSLDISDFIKRSQNFKTNSSLQTQHLNTKKSIHQSSTPDLAKESFPYERFNSGEEISSPEPQLINSDQISTSSSDSSHYSTPEPERHKIDPLINFDHDDNNPLLPSPIVVNVINIPIPSTVPRQIPQIDSKIKQLQSELQHKVQTFDGKRINPKDEYGQKQKEIKTLVKQFDPLDDSNYLNKTKKSPNEFSSTTPVIFRCSDEKSFSNIIDRHPSLCANIQTNHVNAVLQNMKTNFGTTSRLSPLSQQNNNENIRYSPLPTTLISKMTSDDLSMNFDPLAPSNEKTSYPSQKTDQSNLIDF